MMFQHNDGGPAFPTTLTADQNGVSETISGMTLLDWFAGQVLMGNLSYATINPMSGNWQENARDGEIAENCYDVAAAMIAEKRRREGGAT